MSIFFEEPETKRPYTKRRKLLKTKCTLCGDDMLTLHNREDSICGECTVKNVRKYRIKVNSNFKPPRY
jgi:hypothetical protein